jgi:hypothetical protein
MLERVRKGSFTGGLFDFFVDGPPPVVMVESSFDGHLAPIIQHMVKTRQYMMVISSMGLESHRNLFFAPMLKATGHALDYQDM